MRICKVVSVKTFFYFFFHLKIADQILYHYLKSKRWDDMVSGALRSLAAPARTVRVALGRTHLWHHSAQCCGGAAAAASAQFTAHLPLLLDFFSPSLF